MPIRIIRLGSTRAADEGTRIGTVRRPPRGVAKSEFATGNWYDVWYPTLAPSLETMKLAQTAETDAQWEAFERAFRREMKEDEPRRSIELLAALSQHANFSIGCYCENEARCHRSILRHLLQDAGASFAQA